MNRFNAKLFNPRKAQKTFNNPRFFSNQTQVPLATTTLHASPLAPQNIPQPPRNWSEYKHLWSTSSPQQRFSMGLHAFTTLGLISLATQPFVNSTLQHAQQQWERTTEPHISHPSAVSSPSPKSPSTTAQMNANIDKYMSYLKNDAEKHSLNAIPATALLSGLKASHNLALASIPDRPPYEKWDNMRNMVPLSDDPEELQKNRIQARQLEYSQQEMAFTRHKRGKFEQFLEEVQEEQVDCDDDDEDFLANMWMIAHASPKYLFEHSNIEEAQQAKLITHKLQDLPPLVINGKLYPTYDNYMQSQGFKPITGNYYNPAGSYGLVALFTAITLMYNRLPRFENFFVDNFTLSYDNRLKPWTYLTSALTHFNLPHLGFNSMALLSFAPSLGVISPQAFVSLFTGLALFSSVSSLALTLGIARLLLWRGIARPSLLTPAVGASGALTGMVAMSALTHPDNTASVFFLPYSFNIMTLLGVFLTLDSLGFLSQCFGKSTGLSHAGHLGGYLGGILFFNYARNRFEDKYATATYRSYSNWVENTLNPINPADSKISRFAKKF